MFILKRNAQCAFFIVVFSFSGMVFGRDAYMDIRFGEGENELRIAVPYSDNLQGKHIEVSNSSSKNNAIISEHVGSIWLKALIEFYVSAKNNNVKKVVDLHYPSDGSQHRMQEQISKRSDFLKGFSQVTGVEIGKVFRWGNYSAVGVKWLKDGKVLGRWAHLFYCGDTVCRLSDRLLNQDDSFEFLSRLMFLERTNGAKSTDIDRKSRNGIALYNADKHKIWYSFKPIPFKENILKDVFLADIPPKNARILDEAIFHFGRFFNEVKRFHETSFDDQISSTEALDKIYVKYWDNDYSRQFIQNYSLKAEEAGKIEVSSRLFAKSAIAITISENKNIAPKYYFSDQEHIYVWFSTDKFQQKPALIFAYNKAGKTISSPLSSDLWAILVNPIFAREIINDSDK